MKNPGSSRFCTMENPGSIFKKDMGGSRALFHARNFHIISHKAKLNEIPQIVSKSRNIFHFLLSLFSFLSSAIHYIFKHIILI